MDGNTAHIVGMCLKLVDPLKGVVVKHPHMHVILEDRGVFEDPYNYWINRFYQFNYFIEWYYLPNDTVLYQKIFQLLIIILNSNT